MTWLDRAARRGHPDPEAWFTSDLLRLQMAMVVCATCPVTDKCGDVASDEHYGVWPGVPHGPHQRAVLCLPERVCATP